LNLGGLVVKMDPDRGLSGALLGSGSLIWNCEALGLNSVRDQSNPFR
jgi:hypothetical protein